MSILDQFQLKNKVAIVTGASKGIGAAIAAALAEAGAKVVISSRKQDALDELAKQMKKQKAQVTAVAANTGSRSDLEKLVSETVAVYGGIDIIVNNAATNPAFGPTHQVDEGVFDKIMDVNVKGPYLLAKLAYPHMKSRGGGSIINISSIGGLSPEPMLGLYSVSKAALISLTKVQAKELGSDGIRANVICPGLIKTKFSEALWTNDKLVQMMLKQQPIARIGTPEDVAGMALYLAAPASGFVTGGVFTADGGFTV
jgi:dehydrogenase/reductase SDR family member 4